MCIYYPKCLNRAEWICKCAPQIGLFCLNHINNHMSEKQNTHQIERIYKAPIAETKTWVIDSLSRKANELEAIKRETLNKYSQVYIQSQNSFEKGIRNIDSGINYCQDLIAKVMQTAEISVFEKNDVLLSLLQTPDEALKIVANETSKIKVKDKIRFYAVLDGDLEHLITEKISKELNEKISDLINENKRLNKRLQILEERNICLNAFDPALIQEQFDIQNKSFMDNEAKLSKIDEDIKDIKNKTEKIQETISKIQNEEIVGINKIENPIQIQEESKEAQVGSINRVPAIFPVQMEMESDNLISDEQVEKLSSLFGFSPRVARWMLMKIGSYNSTESLLLELLDQNKGNQGGNADQLAENIADTLSRSHPVDILRQMAENTTTDFEEMFLSILKDDIEKAFFITTNKDMYLKAFKKAYEKAINRNN
ncbi:unnamed protein product [Blepharisma stoltei]|uniref:Uncharacterized protein n=1 Tax=Blepharisma stoltei TaxID=1481888 RepID=A0AAU9IAS6_9CILI|nr:unnamed protein product [Blepharisma stoltei]